MKRIWYFLIFAFVFSLLLGAESRAQRTTQGTQSADVRGTSETLAESDTASL